MKLGIAGIAFCLGIQLACGAASAAETFQCPATLDGRKLTGLTLFDGPPEQLASQVPSKEGRYYAWELTPSTQAGDGYYLRCAYNGTTRTLDFRPARTARKCTNRSSAGQNGPFTVVCE